MKTIIGTILITALLAPLAAAAKPPLCNTQAVGAKHVRIDVDTDATPPTANPERCTIGNDTKVTWWSPKMRQQFHGRWDRDSADSGNAAEFHSNRKKMHHESTVVGKHVEAKTEFAYTLRVDERRRDPALIIDPVR
jgi:hypothetical protein